MSEDQKKSGRMGLVRKYFGFESISEFGKEWKDLTEMDKDQLAEGIENGTETY